MEHRHGREAVLVALLDVAGLHELLRSLRRLRTLLRDLGQLQLEDAQVDLAQLIGDLFVELLEGVSAERLDEGTQQIDTAQLHRQLPLHIRLEE
jgi:hypothetical protein